MVDMMANGFPECGKTILSSSFGLEACTWTLDLDLGR